MDIQNRLHTPNAQKKYRRSQASKGLVRYEIQINEESKQRFEAVVAAVADEYEQPWSQRQRMAKARMQVFDEITQGIIHQFFLLQDQIKALREEIGALSPQFFKVEPLKTQHLPQAIQALPDDPSTLKTLITQLHKDTQQAKQQAKEYRRQAKQYLELYETLDHTNDELRQQLNQSQDALTHTSDI